MIRGAPQPRTPLNSTGWLRMVLALARFGFLALPESSPSFPLLYGASLSSSRAELSRAAKVGRRGSTMLTARRGRSSGPISTSILTRTRSSIRSEQPLRRHGGRGVVQIDTYTYRFI